MSRPSHEIPKGPPCATCGSQPSGVYRNGSPAYSCGPHRPIYRLADCHPDYRAWVAAYAQQEQP